MIYWFEGKAGTGKTTSMINKLNALLETNPLLEHEKILALTYMHGSRTRLQQKLHCVKNIRGKFFVRTFDSFAWDIIVRWRDLLIRKGFVQTSYSFEETCDFAANLLSEPIVCRWVRNTYPVLIVDEAQDLDPYRLNILKALSSEIEIIIAADEFQRLSDTPCVTSPTSFTCTVDRQVLETIYRTSNHAILEAASNLRDGKGITGIKGLGIYSVPSCYLAGGIVQKYVIDCRYSDIALLTPSYSSFTSNMLAWLEKPTTTSGKAKPPIRIIWEATNEKTLEEVYKTIQDFAHEPLIITDIQSLELGIFKSPLCQWCEKQYNIKRKGQFSKDELKEKLRYFIQSFRPQRYSNLKGMTIHQAKNREFKNVVIIWPLRVMQNPDYQRRLLYNAITRAIENAIIIVEDPKKERLGMAPFI